MADFVKAGKHAVPSAEQADGFGQSRKLTVRNQYAVDACRWPGSAIAPACGQNEPRPMCGSRSLLFELPRRNTVALSSTNTVGSESEGSKDPMLFTTNCAVIFSYA